MPGICTFLFSNKTTQYDLEAQTSEENGHTTIFMNPFSQLFFNSYEGYPYDVWQTGEQVILLEGVIYNQSTSSVFTSLQNIAKTFVTKGDCKTLIKNFVEKTDGDFVVEIFDVKNNRLLLFNDKWGRLPINYFLDGDIFGISRELKNLLPYIPKIQLNRFSLVEFLYFEFPLGDKTLIDNILRLSPSSMLIASILEDEIKMEVSQTAEVNFDSEDVHSSYERCVNALKDSFNQSTKSRVETLNQSGFQLIADLSGGFDSRAVLGGLEKHSHNVIYCTQKLATGDERKWGEAIFNVMGAPGVLLTASSDHSYQIDKLGDFVYQSDCLVNLHTGFTSRQNVIALKQLVDGKVARFMGFGGCDFLRHPLKAFRKSLLNSIDKDLFFNSNISLQEVCKIVGISYYEYRAYLTSYLKGYHENTREGLLRRLYFEYQSKYVNAAGEDQWRKFFWTVTPFWGLEFMNVVTKQTPLKWTGYKIFINFMNCLDPRLLKAPIYGKRIKLSSPYSIGLYELFEQAKAKATSLVPLARDIYKKSRDNAKDYQEWKKIKMAIKKITNPSIERVLPSNGINALDGNIKVARRFVTVMLYLRELNRIYGEKITQL